MGTLRDVYVTTLKQYVQREAADIVDPEQQQQIFNAYIQANTQSEYASLLIKIRVWKMEEQRINFLKAAKKFTQGDMVNNRLRKNEIAYLKMKQKYQPEL